MKQMCGSGWSQSSCGSAPRHFLTKDEKIELLKEYKESLEKEAQAVGEKVERLRKE